MADVKNQLKTLDELKRDIAMAATTGDDAGFNSLIKEYNSRKADIAKALQEQARKEGEALAGGREKLAKTIHKAVTLMPDIVAQLTAVKATGFTYKLDAEGITYKSVALAVPVVKARKGGGGSHTSSKVEFGISLDEIFNQFGTAEDKEKLEVAESPSLAFTTGTARATLL